MSRVRHISLFFLLFSAATAWGQNDQPKGIEYHTEVPDSEQRAAIYLFHSHPYEVKIQQITHPENGLTGSQFCDRLDALDGNYYLTVTELGHPHLEVFRNYSARLGSSYKPSLYPGWFKTPDNVNFYQTRHPYTLISYNSSLNRDYQVHLTHTQNITSRWNFAVDYHLLSPKGVYTNTAASDHLFDFNTNYYSADSRYQLAGGVIWQKMVIGENGGLLNEAEFLAGRAGSAAGVPMVSNTRGSFSRDVTYFVRQSFNTVRQFEWYRPIRRQVTDTVVDTAKHDTLFRLRDTVVGYDTLQPHSPKVFNTGVVRLNLQHDRHKYRYTDSLFYNRFVADLFWTNDAYHDHRWVNPLKLQVGIRPEFEWVKLDESAYTQSSYQAVTLFPYVQAQFSPLRAAELTLLAEATPDLDQYNLDGLLVFPFRDTSGNSQHSLRVHAAAESYDPDAVYHLQCLRIGSPVAFGSLKNIGVAKAEAQYVREGLLDAGVSANYITHNFYFERRQAADGSATLLCPVNAASGALLLQGRVNMTFCFWDWLHYDMQQLLQYSTNQESVRVPFLASKNSIYADFRVFRKALHAQVGVDLRYHTRYKADAYDPALGVFYRQDEVEVGNYLWGDVFVNLQIKKATLYLKAGHVNSLLEKENYCIVPHYPAKPFGLSFGLIWRFYD